MRARNISIALAVIGLLAVALMTVPYYLVNAKYLGFKHKSTNYHADFAKACDFMLAHYPLGTNIMGADVSVNDAALPQIVREVHPVEIHVATNHAWVLVRGGHIGGLAIIWEPRDETQTNWALSITDGEGKNDVVYTASR